MTALRSAGFARPVAAGLTALAVGLATFDDGGYSAGSRIRFAIVALLAAAAACACAPSRARRLATSPVLLVLLALGVIGAVSTAWTVGSAGDAWRWGLVTGAFAAVGFAAAVLVAEVRDAELAAGVIAVVAVGMSVIGLVAAAVTDAPLAHYAGEQWRPASTFQYSPALALLIVSALPPLIAALCRAARAWQQVLAGAGASIAGAALVLAESRTQLAFAVIVAAAALIWPERLVRAPRSMVAAALALIAAAGLAAYAVAGGFIPETPRPDGTGRLLGLAAVVAAGALAWPLVRAGLRRGGPAALLVAALLAAGVVATVAKPVPRVAAAGIVGQESVSGAVKRDHTVRTRLLHGRLDIWREALDSFADRPLHGGGADAYWFASADHQEGRTVFYAHSLPLELAAELGIAGLLLALALYAAAGRALWRARAGPAVWLLGPAAAAFLAANLVDWPWHLAGSGAVWALALGAILGTAGATRSAH
jgi:hypothetical protein